MRNPLLRPADNMGLVRQCAWCRAIANATGAYGLPTPDLLGDATHGICPTCSAVLRRAIRAQPAQSVAVPLR